MIAGEIYQAASSVVLLPCINRTETFIERSRGLLGCKELQEGHGLLITPCNSVHTFFMRIVIDVIFLDKHYNILSIKQNMKPYRLAMHPKASSVLELRAGQSSLSGMHRGDHLLWKQCP